MFDTMHNVPKTELESRIKKMQFRLAENDIDGALILQNTDLYYFSGTVQQSYLYIPAQGDPLLMVQKDQDRAMAESAVTGIVPVSGPDQIPEILRKQRIDLPRAVGLELDVLPVNRYIKFQKIFSGSEISDISEDIRLIRAVKSEYEIEMIQKASQLADKVAESVEEFLVEGIPEIELAGKIEATARKLGHQGIIRMRLWGSELFYGHLMAGDSAAVPSYLSSPTGGAAINPAIAQGPGQRPVRRHEPILVDYVFAFNGYLADHARIFSLGDLPDELIIAHKAMLSVQELVKQSAKPGTRSGELYEIALEKTNAFGFGNHFMGFGSSRIQFVGHGVGLELDEFPFLAKNQEIILEKNMVIALEPKLIFPGKGVVGIENTHVVGDDGLNQLTRFEEDIIVLK
ncbi:MAG: Xaa-Pro peptidase family protein [Desulfobacterales bacterium]